MTLTFYETVFDGNDAVWKKFYQRMKQSCNITIVETYPTAKDYDLQRVIAAITFWYSDNSIVVNMMGVAVEDKDVDRLYDDVLKSPNRIIDWRGKGVGVFLLRLIYVYYKHCLLYTSPSPRDS